ncbi:MAG: molybdopterin oxidoreductase family protein [Desulfitobacteriaceae bacterium]
MVKYYSVCPHDCPDTCGWNVEVVDGKITRVVGAANHPITQGIICDKARYYPQRVYGSDRILYPMKRTGSKGSGKFIRITWDEALGEITRKWQKLIQHHGAESILPYSYAGTEGIINKASMDRRFFYRLGATRLERTICSSAGSLGYKLVYGQAIGVNPLESVHAKLIIFWGINALETNLHQALLAEKARKNGAKIIVIDVHRNKTAQWADEFYQVLPGSDGALAMGLAHIIFRDALDGSNWSKKYCLGLPEYAAEAKNYPPEKVAQITGLSIDKIEELAQMYSQIRPNLIRIGNGLQHHDNGGMVTWAIACLPALIGAWEDQGGGAIKFNSGYFPLDVDALERPDLMTGFPRVVNMNRLGRVLTELEQPIYSLYVYNSNPAVVAPEQSLIIKGLAREELFTVVHEQVWTDTARWADLVLPATTHLEHPDLYASYWHCVLQWADPVIEPLGESKSNLEVFKALAQWMGFEDRCFLDTPEDIVAQALNLPYWRERGVDLQRLRREHFIPLPTIPDKPYATGGFATFSAKAELYSEKALELGLNSVPCHRPLVEGPEKVNNKDSEYPLTLISPPNHSFLNSTFANVPELKKRAGMATLEIHPEDAKQRQINSSEMVRVFNARGSCKLQAIIAETVLPGVVVASGLWSLEDYHNHQGINCLTSDRLADLGNGATFFSNLVQVEKAKL